MIRNILLSALASLKRKKMASLFTILTISLGMTMVVLLASLYHSYTGNVGPYINRDRCLYLSDLKFGKDGKIVRRVYPGYEHASVGFIDKTIRKIETPCLVGFYGMIEEKNLGSRYNPFRIKSMETDANFWKIHRFNFIDGKPFSEEDIASKANVVVISHKVARQLFGDDKAVGKTLFAQKVYRVVGAIENVNPHFEVGADFYSPYSSTLNPEDASFTFENDNGETVFVHRGAYKGVVLAQSRSDLGRIKRDFNGIIAKMNQAGQVEEFEKVEVTLKSPWQLIPAYIGFDRNNNMATVIFVSMALIFLLLPLVILSNVNLYALRERLEEIGLRRSFGATRRDIVRQFFAENILVTAIGSILALFLAYGLNHLLAYIIYRTAEIPGFGFDLPLFFYLLIGIVLFGLATIVVPVWRISRIQPVVALHQNNASHSTFFHFRRRKKWMQLATYFLLSLVLILCCFLFSAILKQKSPLGYETKNVLRIMVDEGKLVQFNQHDDQFNSTHFDGFRESLQQIPGIEKVSYVLEDPPFAIWMETQYRDLMIGNETKNISTLETDSVFFDLLEIKPVKGRLYSSETVDGNYIPAVTTLAGEKELFDGNAVGQVVLRKADGQKLKIIGVIEKYRNSPNTSDFKGIMICRNRPSRSVLIKVRPDANGEAIFSQILSVMNNWKGTGLTFVCNDNIEESKSETMEGLYSVFYAVILAISFLFLNVFLGYLTLNYYNVQTRRKEMGIRRAAGANKPGILLSILGENLLTMLPGFLLAFVIFWQLLYLDGYDEWDTFREGVWLALAISLLLTIGSALFPAYLASKVQPVEALAEE